MVQEIDNWRNSEKCKEYYRQRYLKLKDTEKNKKSILLSNWRQKGLVGDYEEIYKKYKEINNCEKCNIELTYDKKPTPTRKCMDHDHETGSFRFTLCNKCTTHNLEDKHCNKNNKSTGVKNITKTVYGFRFVKRINGKTIRKRFKTLEEAIAFKESV